MGRICAPSPIISFFHIDIIYMYNGMTHLDYTYCIYAKNRVYPGKEKSMSSKKHPNPKPDIVETTAEPVDDNNVNESEADFSEVDNTEIPEPQPEAEPENGQSIIVDEETLKSLFGTGFFNQFENQARPEPEPETQKTQGGKRKMTENNFEEMMSSILNGDDMSNIDPGTRQLLLFYIKQLLTSGAIREDDLLEVRRQADYEAHQQKKAEKEAEKERQRAEKEASKANKKPLSTGAKIAIGVGITAGVLIIGGVTFYIIKKKIDEKKATQELCYDDAAGKLRMLVDNGCDNITTHIETAMSTAGCGEASVSDKFSNMFGNI